MSEASIPPKPRGIHLLLLACGIAVSLPVLCTRLGFREYDLDPRILEARAFWSFMGSWLLVLPVSAIILNLISDKQLSPRIRTLIVISPAIIVNLPAMKEAILSPASVRTDFAERMNQPLPSNATGLRAWFSHGKDSSYMFCFNTTPETTNTLLESGGFKLLENPMMTDPEIGRYSELPIGGVRIPAGWPQPKTWEGLEVYSSRTIKDYGFILTNGLHTKVFLLVGDT